MIKRPGQPFEERDKILYRVIKHYLAVINKHKNAPKRSSEKNIRP